MGFVILILRNQVITHIRTARQCRFFSFEHESEAWRYFIFKHNGTFTHSGNENGKLILTADMMKLLTVLDSAGVFD